MRWGRRMALPKHVDARRFARVAKRRLDEAKVIHTRVHLNAAAQYLGGYAIECILKALVLHRTPPSKQLRSAAEIDQWMKKSFGHDLNSLRIYLDKYGEHMPPDVAREFLFVSTWDPQLRYDPGPDKPERTRQFLLSAEAVVQWASERM